MFPIAVPLLHIVGMQCQWCEVCGMHNNLGVRRPRLESQLFLQLALQTGVNHVPFHKILPSFVEYQDSSFILQLLSQLYCEVFEGF